MSANLQPIPAGVAITERDGTISTFFRLAWQSLINNFQFVPTLANIVKTFQTAAILSVAAFTTLDTGVYRISYYMEKTVADGVNSSLTMTLGWVNNNKAFTQPFAALVLDTTLAFQQNSITVRAQGNSDLTFAIAYGSATPNKMQYDAYVTVERLS